MKRNATTVLLSVIALALVVIAVKPTPTAVAQPKVQIAPSVVGMTKTGNADTYRIWSDGVVENRRMTCCQGGLWIWVDPEWTVVEYFAP